MFNANLQKQRHQLSLKFYFYKTHIKEKVSRGAGWEKDSTGTQCHIKGESPPEQADGKPEPVKDLERKMLFAENHLIPILSAPFLAASTTQRWINQQWKDRTWKVGIRARTHSGTIISNFFPVSVVGFPSCGQTWFPKEDISKGKKETRQSGKKTCARMEMKIFTKPEDQPQY
ncbi:hypothetical protein GB937_005995 [Aspergillus fischeri]|nr:hypothetical protein GB937_005995 [Aspergillus fischeri]